MIPWYIKYWKAGLLAVVLILGTLYISRLQGIIEDKNKQLHLCQEQVVKITADYKNDIKRMTNAIVDQNNAIAVYEKESALARERIAKKLHESIQVRTMTEAQVMKILNQKKPVDCKSSIQHGVNTVQDLGWDKIK